MRAGLQAKLDGRLRQQHGLITRQQAVEAGASFSQIDRLVRSGRWLRLERGLFRVTTAPETWAQRLTAALLSVGEKAVVSHNTAAQLWGFIDPTDGPVHVTVPRARWRSRAFVVHRSTDLAPHHHMTHRGVPVTTPARTIVDLGSTSNRWETERALDAALRRRAVDIDDIAEIVDDVARQGRRGVPVARELVSARRNWITGTESALEDEFVKLIAGARLPSPSVQVDLVDASGRWIGRVDFAYQDAHLAIELDGYAFHSDPAAFVRDRERQNRLQMAGYRVLRFTAADLRDRPAEVAAEVRSFLEVPGNGSVENRRVD